MAAAVVITSLVIDVMASARARVVVEKRLTYEWRGTGERLCAYQHEQDPRNIERDRHLWQRNWNTQY